MSGAPGLPDGIQRACINRRDLLKRAAAVGVSLPIATTLLAACGSDSEEPEVEASATGVPDDASIETQSADGSPTEGPSDQASESLDEPKQGGRLVIGHLGEARTINPFLNNTITEYFRAGMLFDELVRIDSTTLEPVPRLASTWEISEDAFEFRFTLEENVTFSDGTPLTMEDISFFIQGALNPDVISPLAGRFASIDGAEAFSKGESESVAGIEVPDELTLVIRLSEANVGFLPELQHVRPVPKQLLDGKDLSNDPFFENPIGAGPFTFVSWQSGEDFVTKGNESYWQEGKPYLDEVIHRVIPDAETLVLALETGEIDASDYALPTAAEGLYEIDTLSVQVPPPGVPDGWAFNLDHEALSKVEVRRAIALSMNMEQFAADFLHGLGGVGVGPIAPGNWAFDESLEPHPYDPERAKELMAEGGYPDGGFSIQFTTNSGNVLREDFLTFTQAAFEPLGITVEVNLTEWGQVVEAATTGTFEAICPTWSGALIDPDELYATLHSESARNVFNYSNAELDELLVEGRVTVDKDARKQIYARVQEILMEDVPIFWAWYRPFVHVRKSTYAGGSPEYRSDTWGQFSGLETWWVKEE